MTCYNSELPIGPPGPTGPQGPRGESATSAYKVYTALLSQNGSAVSPTAIELENTLGDISFTYNDIGKYYIVSDSLFTVGKTFVIVGPLSNGLVDGFSTIAGMTASEIFLFTETTNYFPVVKSDAMLDNTAIEIRVYN